MLLPPRLRITFVAREELQHPSDTRALDVLKKMRGLDTLVRKVIEWGLEGGIRQELLANCVRVGPIQCPSLHRLYSECAEVLGVREPPELFVECNPHPASYTVGVSKAMVVVSTGLVEVMDDDELRFVLGHELGHHICQHTLYLTMARYISQLLALVGKLTLSVGEVIGKGLEVALLSWSRVSDFSADRAGLLACQDLDAAIRALVKLSVPARRLWNEINVEELLRQAEELEAEPAREEEPEGKLARLKARVARVSDRLRGLTIGRRTQPWPVLRIKELVSWARSDIYKAILARGVPLGGQRQAPQA